MSQKYLYKGTLERGNSMGSASPGCKFQYEIGKIYTATIPNSLLIGFRTLREAIQFIYPQGIKNRNKIFRCLPMTPVIKINCLTYNFCYEGFADFWNENRHLVKKFGDYRKCEERSPSGTCGCYQIKVLAEIKTNFPNYYSL